jgi:DNA-binding transcriptional LysR family regulator
VAQTAGRVPGSSDEAGMTALIDIDQLRTFIAISESGSFTRAAEMVNKTQSAVSMQMKRLEERIERPIFVRDGRASKLTEDGLRLLDYARRIVKLNMETIAAFSAKELFGRVRLGVPDDYADRYLPEIMARFSRAYPGVELSVICEPSVDLLDRIDSSELDLAIVTNCEARRVAETFRRERLLWVTSNRHPTHTEEPLPLALGRPSCAWRRTAIDELEKINNPHRILYTSSNAGAVAAAVLAGLAVSVLAESGLRPGMRVLTAADGFPELPSCRIGLVRNPRETSQLADALAEHIVSSLDNLSDASQAAE